MKTEVKINMVSIGMFILIVFILGYCSHKESVNRKEIKSLENKVKDREVRIDTINMELIAAKDTIVWLKTTIGLSKIKINGKYMEVQKLKEQIAELQKQPEIPISQQYDTIIKYVGRDTLPKLYPLSGRQVGVLYDNNMELMVSREAIETYQSYSDMLFLNLTEVHRLSQHQDTIIALQQAIEGEYLQIISIKNDEIKLLKKAKSKGRFLNYVLGGIAAGLAVIAVAK